MPPDAGRVVVPAAMQLSDALDIVREMYRKQLRKVPPSAPTGFIPESWRKVVITSSGIDRKYYEFCVLNELKGALRSGDIWVKGSKPVLKCLICSLYATFSLWAVGTNQLDPQFRKYTTKLCDTGRGGTTIVDPENAVLVAVERKGFSVLLEILAGGHHVIKG